MSHATPFTADETLARLIEDPQVQGCLILLRSTGSILKTVGSLFERTSVNPEIPDGLGSLADEYALRCWNIVRALSSEVSALDAAQSGDSAPNTFQQALQSRDVFKFARIRTKRHELIISPGSLDVLSFCCPSG